MEPVLFPPSGIRGFCNISRYGEGKRCLPQHVKGSWTAPDLTTCLVKCRNCERCHFVSFDPASRDCSWYRWCPKVQWEAFLPGYDGQHYTYQVRSPSGAHITQIKERQPEEVTWGGHVVGRLPFGVVNEDTQEATRILESLQDACEWGKQRHRRRFFGRGGGSRQVSCKARLPVLVVGTLTMADDHSYRLRLWHRGAHCTQHCISVLMRYVLNVDDVKRAKQKGEKNTDASLAAENATYNDLVMVDVVPSGFDFASDATPRGAQCVLKVRIPFC